MGRLRALAQLIALLLAVSLVAAGCGDDDESPDEPLVFGEGELPDSLPDDLPIPAGAAVGSTMVDHPASTTEVNLVINTDLTAAVSEFTVGLVNEGYVVDRSQEQAGQWLVEFSRDSLTGRMILIPSGRATQATLTVVDP